MAQYKRTMSLYVNMEKEQAWLNNMASKGWVLSKMSMGGLITTFERCEPNEYEIQMEIMKYPKSTKQGQEYLKFLSDAGIESVYSFGGYSYYRKKADGTPFELYTDTTSKIQHLRRKKLIYWNGGWTNLILGILCLGLYTLLACLTGEFLLIGFIVGVICLLLGLVFIGAANPYRKQIKELMERQNIDGEISLDAESNTAKKAFGFPYAGITIALILIAAVVGGMIGYFSA